MWLGSEVLTLACFVAGAYRSLKVLKDALVDFDLLIYWAVLGVVQLYSAYFEWIVG